MASVCNTPRLAVQGPCACVDTAPRDIFRAIQLYLLAVDALKVDAQLSEQQVLLPLRMPQTNHRRQATFDLIDPGRTLCQQHECGRPYISHIPIPGLGTPAAQAPASQAPLYVAPLGDFHLPPLSPLTVGVGIQLLITLRLVPRLAHPFLAAHSVAQNTVWC
ncbi:hypothetical protein B0H10DRAFT_2209708 [Mycena sp. CBHHK59/15]|nr:hypothetical protein B0H10DRAFT_2209708 [Mycena sp. CBHHK59/15]